MVRLVQHHRIRPAGAATRRAPSASRAAPGIGCDDSRTIPFGLIASIVAPGLEERGAQRATVTLHSGEELQLERTGDLGERNAGLLIFFDGRQRPEYVPWTDVEQVDFDRPPAMYQPSGLR